MTLSNEQARIIAAAVRPLIRAYIEANEEEYKRFLQTEAEREAATMLKSRRGGGGACAQ